MDFNNINLKLESEKSEDVLNGLEIICKIIKPQLNINGLNVDRIINFLVSGNSDLDQIRYRSLCVIVDLVMNIDTQSLDILFDKGLVMVSLKMLENSQEIGLTEKLIPLLNVYLHRGTKSTSKYRDLISDHLPLLNRLVNSGSSQSHKLTNRQLVSNLLPSFYKGSSLTVDQFRLILPILIDNLNLGGNSPVFSSSLEFFVRMSKYTIPGEIMQILLSSHLIHKIVNESSLIFPQCDSAFLLLMQRLLSQSNEFIYNNLIMILCNTSLYSSIFRANINTKIHAIPFICQSITRLPQLVLKSFILVGLLNYLVEMFSVYQSCTSPISYLVALEHLLHYDSQLEIHFIKMEFTVLGLPEKLIHQDKRTQDPQQIQKLIEIQKYFNLIELSDKPNSSSSSSIDQLNFNKLSI
ncbi:hypothetical protein DLAC_10498 [Tieghemostelium lacteum]|uniref:Uncharacterized protein n=1 Tax=Tieghemostelium lacteum TaxID=361077 RepID=A0A151Z4S0_TIELA|nr:hypothetical protein DLAC_10498 [Tieghemostelium lacteum]|eukprot:KYQ88917.1 hypothetical protein DLAC_10498 [Tieghemostelium lacteum]